MLSDWSIFHFRQVEKRKKPECDGCKDDSNNSKCCACSVCGGKQDPDKQILCDECDMAFHIWCLDPPLIDVPDEDDWCVFFLYRNECGLDLVTFRYCPQCKTDVSEVIKAGEKPRLSKKKANMVSKKQETKRHWGKVGLSLGRVHRWMGKGCCMLELVFHPPRGWHVSDVRRYAPLFPLITLAPSPGYQSDLCGSSVFK